MIKVIYNKTCGRCVQSEPLTSGMVGQTVEFEYSADFDGLELTAVFTNGKKTVDVLNPDKQCVIPHEVLDTVGTVVKVGIYATRGGELVIPTVYATIGIVLKGADPSGDTSVDPTLPVWAQLQTLIGDLADLETEAKNNLVAAINEAAQTGGGGSASIAMRVEGGYIQYSTDNGKTWVNLIAEADLKGADGHTPVKGTDYWTEKDKTEIVESTKDAIDLSNYARTAEVEAALADKQNTISDLDTIRSGAGKGATALQAVPSTYRTASAQDVIDNGLSDRVDAIEGKETSWDSKYSKPASGIPKTDLASAVQVSLDRVDTLTDAYINNLINAAVGVIENGSY